MAGRYVKRKQGECIVKKKTAGNNGRNPERENTGKPLRIAGERHGASQKPPGEQEAPAANKTQDGQKLTVGEENMRRQPEAREIKAVRRNPYSFKRLFHAAFNLNSDQASYEEIADRIESGVVLRGTNMCILILAIFIASVGLNMNSTAVIIGAMLVSPLMGAIMGMGFAVAIHDMDLLKRSATILLFEVVVALATSTAYFALTPIKTAGSELLARTSPAVWDVIIAISGGLAGMIGTTRKEKSNIIPGVAIATALMPPLCTAGYGLAVGNWRYFAGAMYLFTINGVFIAISTMLITVFLRLPSKNKANPETKKQIHMRLIMIAVVAIVPSVYFAADIAKKTVFENNVVSYMEKEFQFDNTQVVKYSVDDKSKELNVAVIGNTLSDEEIKDLKKAMKNYHIDSLKLKVHQTKVRAGVTTDELEAYVNKQTSLLTAENEEDYQALQAELLAVASELSAYKEKDLDVAGIEDELRVLYPSVTAVYAGYLSGREREKLVVVLQMETAISAEEMQRAKAWLEKRLEVEEVVAVQQVGDTMYEGEPPKQGKKGRNEEQEADGQVSSEEAESSRTQDAEPEHEGEAEGAKPENSVGRDQ